MVDNSCLLKTIADVFPARQRINLWYPYSPQQQTAKTYTFTEEITLITTY